MLQAVLAESSFPMQHVLAVLMLSLLALPDPQGTSSNARIAQVPEGTIAQSIYRNDAFDVSFQIRDGWTATLIPAGSVQFAPERTADDPVNQCSRALFSSQPSHPASKPFGPKATYFAFDPECFPGAPFPRSTKDRAAVTKFARRVVHAFAHTPYIPPGGADFGGIDAGRRAFVTLVADKNVVVPGNGPPQGDTVHVNMLLMLTESNGYWVVMAAMVDDASKGIMQAARMGVSKRR
jgi:hypothetical protein